MSIVFVTDSMIDMPETVESHHTYTVLPIPVVVGEHEYASGVDLTTEMLLKMVEKNPQNFPKTAQVPAIIYKEIFEESVKAGNDVICLTLSSGLSGTYQTAYLMAQEVLEAYPDRRIEVIDSLTVSIGMAMILLQGLKLYQLHKSFDEIVASMRFLTNHVQIYFSVGDIKWLAKGGRISKGAAMIGDMLKIVPILYINEGKITVFDKVRGQKKALKRMVELVEDHVTPAEEQIIGIMAPPKDPQIHKVEHMFLKQHPDWQFLVPEKGAAPALAVHTGAEYFGLGFFNALPEDYVPVL